MQKKQKRPQQKSTKPKAGSLNTLVNKETNKKTLSQLCSNMSERANGKSV